MNFTGYTFRIPSYQRKSSESLQKIPAEDKEIKSNSKRLYILTLGCLPTRRKHGVGTKLINHIIEKITEWDQSNQISSVFLHVQTNNEEAIKFYEKFGFNVVTEVENYYPRLTPSSAYILEKQLNEIN